MAPDWRNSVEYRWNKSGHIRGNSMESFLRSGGAIGAPKRYQLWVLWLRTGGTVWNIGGTSQGTSPVMHWNRFWGQGCRWGAPIGPQKGPKLEPPDPLMAQKGCFWQFWTLWGPSGAPIWPSLTREMVSMHHQGCALTCSTLVPLCSTSLEPLDPLMAEKGRFWLFWTLFGGPLAHPYGPP